MNVHIWAYLIRPVTNSFLLYHLKLYAKRRVYNLLKDVALVKTAKQDSHISLTKHLESYKSV